MSTHYVYRCYDMDGALLYVGCTANVKLRIDQHLRNRKTAASQWLTACIADVSVEVETFSSREAALAAEKVAIWTEAPLFNLANGRLTTTTARNRAARYLIEQGHIELAERTACTCWSEDREVGAVSDWCVAHTEQARAVA